MIHQVHWLMFVISDQSSRVIDPTMYTVGNRYSDHQYNDQGIYYSLNRSRSPDQLSFRSNQPYDRASHTDQQVGLIENPYAQRNPQFDRYIFTFQLEVSTIRFLIKCNFSMFQTDVTPS